MSGGSRGLAPRRLKLAGLGTPGAVRPPRASALARRRAAYSLHAPVAMAFRATGAAAIPASVQATWADARGQRKPRSASLRLCPVGATPACPSLSFSSSGASRPALERSLWLPVRHTEGGSEHCIYSHGRVAFLSEGGIIPCTHERMQVSTASGGPVVPGFGLFDLGVRRAVYSPPRRVMPPV